MKLIDLLVQELPKRGGWPVARRFGVIAIAQDCNGKVWGYPCNPTYKQIQEGKWGTPDGDGFYIFKKDLCDDHALEKGFVNRLQYEAALAASQKSAWNGEGLPPVGSLCRYRAFSDMPWVECEVLAWYEGEVWLKRTEDGKTFTMGNPELFPIITEAERKREEGIDGIVNFYVNYHPYAKGAGHYLEITTALYDAIAAGKIPGVKLDG